MEKLSYIYRLLDEKGVPFYIGKADTPPSREKQHKKKFGEDITLEVIDKVPKEVVFEIEKFYIGYYKFKLGYKLKNTSQTNEAVWRKMPDYRDYLKTAGYVEKIKAGAERYGATEEQMIQGVYTFLLFDDKYKKMKDELVRHMHFMRKIDPDYNFEINLKY